MVNLMREIDTIDNLSRMEQLNELKRIRLE
jgi:hypothetical protein